MQGCRGWGTLSGCFTYEASMLVQCCAVLIAALTVGRGHVYFQHIICQ